MRRVRLTEGQLHRIIRHAVNEAIGDDKITNVDGSGGHAKFKVEFYHRGYHRPWLEYIINADDKEKALDIVVAYLDNHHDYSLFVDIDIEGWSDEEIEEMEDYGKLMYVDATMYGAKEPHYIWAKNVKIEEI